NFAHLIGGKMMHRLALLITTFALLAFSIGADPAAPTTAPSDGVFRMKAGTTESFTDPHGHVWQGQKGFPDGDDVTRDAGLKIEKTDMPAFYRNEHYEMSSWSTDLPPGTYTVNLYFCETFEGISAVGDRVFDVKIGDQQLKDFDIYKEAGGACKPITKT